MTCDCCNKREFNERDESEADAFWNAQFHGWTNRKVLNGAIWDFCPKCSKIKTEDLP